MGPAWLTAIKQAAFCRCSGGLSRYCGHHALFGDSNRGCRASRAHAGQAVDEQRAPPERRSPFKNPLVLRGGPRWGRDSVFLTDPSAAESEPIGCCGLGTRQVWIDGHPVQAGLFADFAVDAAHRTLMPALTLQKALCSDAQRRFPVTYGFPNKVAVGIFQRIGFPAPRDGQPLRQGSTLRVVHRAHDTVACGGSARRSGHRRRHEGGRARAGARAEPVAQVGVDRRPRRPLRCALRAGAAEPSNDRRPLQFVPPLAVRRASRTRQRLLAPRGRQRPSPGLCGGTGEGTRRGIGRRLSRRRRPGSRRSLWSVLPALRARGFNAAITFFLGNPSIVNVLKSAGFQERKSARYIVVGAGAGLEVAPKALEKVADWYLTEADRDN